MKELKGAILPSQIAAEYPDAVTYVRDVVKGGVRVGDELVFTAEIIVGGMDDYGVYLTVQEGPAAGEKVYFE